MGGCASKPKEVDSAPCQAPTSPKNNIGGDDQEPLIDLSEPKNPAADSESESAFARPAKATAQESEKKVNEDVVEKADDQKPNKEAEQQVEAVAVVEQAADGEPAFGRPTKTTAGETEKKVIESVVEKTDDQKANNKETEKKVELVVEKADDVKKAAETEPAFARPAEKKAEAVAENAKATAKEVEKIKVEGVQEKVKDAEKETEKKVDAVVVQETEKARTDKADVVPQSSEKNKSDASLVPV